MNFLGCLFILIFGFVFIIIGFANTILRMFGINLFSLYQMGNKHGQQKSNKPTIVNHLNKIAHQRLAHTQAMPTTKEVALTLANAAVTRYLKKRR